ncbi:SDR family NAD(P)-dependent oxidoreductase [Microbacteriaceae bacterium VKM Ac-2855]|nr:SDR family NAD(P)-dependent oxidoreductase [Microbacteriaceae bacterium VKM Ac-2855]
MNIAGCSALVTGGASGLGAAVAAELARAGARVVVLDLPDGDVLDERAVSAAIARASALAPLRIAVNCAGVATPGRTVGRDGPLPLADFERVLRINTVGTFNVVRLAAAAMMETDPVDGERGVIVNTASVAAFDGQIGQAAYAASKGAVAAMTLPLAREFASALVRVVAIAPGLFDTPLLAGLPEAARASLGSQAPHPSRLGRPDEFAALVRHICENSMLNGDTIRLDAAVRLPPR